MTSDHSKPKIGGGQVAPSHIPWHVALFVDIEGITEDTFLGNGVILDSTTMLFSYILQDFIPVFNDKEQDIAFHVRVGKTDLSDDEDSYLFGRVPHNNSAILGSILSLEKVLPLKADDNVKPICLPSEDEPKVSVGAVCYLSGWGTRNKEGVLICWVYKC